MPHPPDVVHASPYDARVFVRLMSYVDTSGGPQACHPWTGSRTPEGYSRLSINGAPRYAHRWLLGYLRGQWLNPGELACHHCDNPPCCNWWHLFVGSPADNNRDCMEKGRYRSGYFGATPGICRKGLHELTADNVYVDRRTGQRKCKTCTRAYQNQYRAARAAR